MGKFISARFEKPLNDIGPFVGPEVAEGLFEVEQRPVFVCVHSFAGWKIVSVSDFSFFDALTEFMKSGIPIDHIREQMSETAKEVLLLEDGKLPDNSEYRKEIIQILKLAEKECEFHKNRECS